MVLQTQVVLAPTHFPNTVDDMIVLKSLPHEMKYYNYTYAHDITKQNTTTEIQSITLLMISVTMTEAALSKETHAYRTSINPYIFT